MKVSLGNLGPLTASLQTSLELLGIEAVVSEANSRKMFELGSHYLPVEMCFPLKLLLGNYLSTIDQKADAVVYFGGCDLCNLAAISNSYRDIFHELGWYPEEYTCAINSKKDFVVSYIDTLRKLSGKSWFEIFWSLSVGINKYEAFHFLDQVFYNIRPAFANKQESENSYYYYYERISNTIEKTEIRAISEELNTLYQEYTKIIDPSTLKVGLVGDSYSLIEPYVHQYLDRKLGHLNVIVDRWTDHRLISKTMKREQDKQTPQVKTLNEIIQNRYGVLTPLEIKKIARYINRGYDGIVFISPFECNPNDALRNLLTSIQYQINIPILTLVFDEHTSSEGTKIRLEAFVDLLNKRKTDKDRKAAVL